MLILDMLIFTKFKNGDMVVETTAIPDVPKRMFYGITKDGKPFFKNNQYHATIEISDQDRESNNARYEAEIFIVSIENKEYLVSIPKGKKFYTEIYDLNDCTKKSQMKALVFLGATEMVSVLNYATNYRDGDNTYFIFPFINKYKYAPRPCDSSDGWRQCPSRRKPQHQ